jgi:hypothetical protein
LEAKEMTERNETMAFLIKNYGSAIRAASVIGMDNSRLSTLVNGHRSPSKSEREKLIAALGPYRYQKFFGKPKAAKIEGERAVNL